MICLKEVLLTHRLHKAGRKPAEIRKAILAGEWKNEPLN